MSFVPKAYSNRFFLIFIFLSLIVILNHPMRTWPIVNTPETCGDGFCSQDETCQNCPEDCRERLTFLSADGGKIINENGHWINLNRRGAGYQRMQDSEDLNPGERFWILLKEVAGQCQITVEPTASYPKRLYKPNL